MEVIGLKSWDGLAGSAMEIYLPYRVAQGGEFDFQLSASADEFIYVQFDGESMKFKGPLSLKITFNKQINILNCSV